MVGSNFPIALVRDARIDRTLGDPLGFTRKNHGMDVAGGGFKVFVLGEGPGLFERRLVAGKYSSI